MGDPLRIFGWQADMAGCAWYRIILPLGQLRHAGLAETSWHGRLDEKDWESDILIAQRSCMEGPTSILQRMARSGSKRPFIVYELDDDLLAVAADNPASATYHNPEIRANIIANMRIADLITVSTEPLAERVAKYNPRVAVLPNCVPGDLLNWQPGRYTDRVTVGWQGSPTHTRDWKAAAEPVRRWFSRARDAGHKVEMHTMGGVPPTFPEVWPHRHTDWEKDIARYYLRLDWHLALAPLADTTFNTSKSDIRVVEAGALGFPVVASDVPAYRDSVIHGETGYLVHKPGDWGVALDALLDPAHREWMAGNARRAAQARSIETNAHRWLEAYNAHR